MQGFILHVCLWRALAKVFNEKFFRAIEAIPGTYLSFNTGPMVLNVHDSHFGTSTESLTRENVYTKACNLANLRNVLADSSPERYKCVCNDILGIFCWLAY